MTSPEQKYPKEEPHECPSINQIGRVTFIERQGMHTSFLLGNTLIQHPSILYTDRFVIYTLSVQELAFQDPTNFAFSFVSNIH